MRVIHTPLEVIVRTPPRHSGRDCRNLPIPGRQQTLISRFYFEVAAAGWWCQPYYIILVVED